MPRTKATKNDAAKRQNNAEKARTAALQELENRSARFTEGINKKLEDCLGEITRTIIAGKGSIPRKVLAMTMAEYQQYNLDKEAGDAAAALRSDVDHGNGTKEATKTAHNSTAKKIGAKYSTDDEESGKSIRCGPLSSAKARPRRSRSAQPLTNYSSCSSSSSSILMAKTRKQQPIAIHGSRSRSKIVTPKNNRLQTMSADRGIINPVTPKIKANTPIAMYRYPAMGETVISLSGSPVIAQGVLQEGANINIPVGNKIFTMQPSNITEVDSDLVSLLDADTLQQLKQLQKNLNLIMGQAENL